MGDSGAASSREMFLGTIRRLTHSHVLMIVYVYINLCWFLVMQEVVWYINPVKLHCVTFTL